MNAPMSTNAELLKVSGLQMRFGGLLAVDGIDFDVRKDEVFAIIGPNGAGKTTVFNCVGGFYKPTAGEVTLDGHAIATTGRDLRGELLPLYSQTAEHSLYQPMVIYATAVAMSVLPLSEWSVRVPTVCIACVRWTSGPRKPMDSRNCTGPTPCVLRISSTSNFDCAKCMRIRILCAVAASRGTPRPWSWSHPNRNSASACPAEAAFSYHSRALA